MVYKVAFAPMSPTHPGPHVPAPCAGEEQRVGGGGMAMFGDMPDLTSSSTRTTPW